MLPDYWWKVPRRVCYERDGLKHRWSLTNDLKLTVKRWKVQQNRQWRKLFTAKLHGQHLYKHNYLQSLDHFVSMTFGCQKSTWENLIVLEAETARWRWRDLAFWRGISNWDARSLVTEIDETSEERCRTRRRSKLRSNHLESLKWASSDNMWK